jgi:hypothetical protein
MYICVDEQKKTCVWVQTDTINAENRRRKRHREKKPVNRDFNLGWNRKQGVPVYDSLSNPFCTVYCGSCWASPVTVVLVYELIVPIHKHLSIFSMGRTSLVTHCVNISMLWHSHCLPLVLTRAQPGKCRHLDHQLTAKCLYGSSFLLVKTRVKCFSRNFGLFWANNFRFGQKLIYF